MSRLPSLVLKPTLDFVISLARLLDEREVSSKLEFPRKTNHVLGPKKFAWCAFHQARRHDTERYQTLQHQLTSLLEKGHLRRFLRSEAGAKAVHKTKPQDDNHVAPVLGDFNTIVGGFSRGGLTSTNRKRYSRTELIFETIELKMTVAPAFCFCDGLPRRCISKRPSGSHCCHYGAECPPSVCGPRELDRCYVLEHL